MRAFATALFLSLTLSISPLSSPLLGQPVPVRAFDVPSVQTFDALGPEGVIAPLGWRAGASEAALTRNLLAGSVQSTAPGGYNVAGADQNDRAVGFLQAKGRVGMIDARFRNGTGSSIDAITVSFDAVQWRFSSDTRAQSGLELLFSSDGMTFVHLGERFSYHAVPDLDFRPLVSRGQSVRVVARVSGRWILPSLLPAGAEFILRWRSTNSQIDGVGFAVDNVSLAVHPVLLTADGDGFATLHNPLLHDSQIFSPGMSQPALLRLRGRPGGPLSTLTVVPPDGWSVGPPASIVLDGPAFRNAALAVKDDRIVIRGADLTDSQLGSILLSECLPPASSSESPLFRVFTSITEQQGEEIQESPKGVLLVGIESLIERRTPPTIQDEIAVEGTVLCPYSLDDTQGEFFLADNGSGIRVIFEEKNINFAHNQKLLVRGRYIEDRARPTVLASQFYQTGTGRLTSLRPASLREILDGARRFEGSLVILRAVRKLRATSAPWPPVLGQTTRYFLTDGEGRDSILLSVHPSSGLVDEPEPKYPLTVRGIVTRVSSRDGSPPRLCILPRFAADLNPVLTPAAPLVRSPEHGEVNVSLVPTLEWEGDTDVLRYHVQLSADTLFASMVSEDSLVVESVYRCPQLASQAEYFWRVRAINADGAGPFSERRNFSTVVHPTVHLVEPVPGEPLLTSSVAVRVARSGFWFAAERESSGELLESQRGFLKISVGGVVQGYVERDSLWVVRLGHGQNVITAELVDRDRRPLHPAVADSTVVTVSNDAWIVRATATIADASSPVLHNSSSLILQPEIRRGNSRPDERTVPKLLVTMDGLTVAQASAATVFVTGMSPGEHRIRLELVDEAGSPRTPRVFDEFSLAVPDTAPFLRISRPSAGDTLDQSGSSVIVERRNLRLQTSPLPSAPGALFGALLMSVNRSIVDTSDHDTLSLGRLAEGPVLVRVEALDVRGMAFDPPVFDEVLVAARASAASEELLEELKAYVLEQNYPNPFNAETEIRFSIPAAGHVTVRVFNLLGQEVALLLDSDLESGPHRVRWDGVNDLGKRVSSGIYMVRMQAGPYVGTRRMLLVK